MTVKTTHITTDEAPVDFVTIFQGIDVLKISKYTNGFVRVSAKSSGRWLDGWTMPYFVQIKDIRAALDIIEESP